MSQIDLKGRYIKVIHSYCISHYKVKDGDYLLFSHYDEYGFEYWGDSTFREAHYYGVKAHKNDYFKLMPVGFNPDTVEENTALKYPKLSVFPPEGVCYQHTKDLTEYLLNRDSSKKNTIGSIINSKGIGWNRDSFWGIYSFSSKPEYHISQLEPFLSSTNKVYPLTPDECFMPKKWAILVTESNIEILNDFYRSHIDEYIGCKKEWSLGKGGYFHYPQYQKNIHTTLQSYIPKDYKIITIEQFKTHILSKKVTGPFDTLKPEIEKQINKIKQDEKRNIETSNREQINSESIKICRLNLEIRQSSPIRATSFRCTTSKIWIRG